MPEKKDNATPAILLSDSSVVELMARVGSRVLAARKEKQYSRRELCEKSGVSPRYLSQLESGEGNISIGLLHRLATALDLTIEEVVSSSAELCAELSHVTSRYRSADAATRAHILGILDPELHRKNKAERICLIGLRGAGKSTLGARLSQELNIPFIELNTEIERNAGIPVSEIIAMYGQEGYRTLEAETLNTIVKSHEHLVLAAAGGLVEQQTSFAEVLGKFHTVWLKADPTEHMERVRAQGDLRPMAGNPRAMAQLREILVARESHYQRAQCHLNTSGKTVDESTKELLQLIEAQGIFAGS